MTQRDLPIWTFTGLFIGMIATAMVNQSYVLIGAIIGGSVGYSLARIVR